jgi:hypothetical protein
MDPRDTGQSTNFDSVADETLKAAAAAAEVAGGEEGVGDRVGGLGGSKEKGRAGSVLSSSRPASRIDSALDKEALVALADRQDKAAAAARHTSKTQPGHEEGGEAAAAGGGGGTVGTVALRTPDQGDGGSRKSLPGTNYNATASATVVRNASGGSGMCGGGIADITIEVNYGPFSGYDRYVFLCISASLCISLHLSASLSASLCLSLPLPASPCLAASLCALS